MSMHPILADLQRLYFRRKLKNIGLLLLGLLINAGAVVYKSKSLPATFLYIILAGTFIAFLFLIRRLFQVWNTPGETIIQHLNRTQPDVEESCHLLLTSPDNLNVLEQLQLNRLQIALSTLDINQVIPVAREKGWYFLLGSIGLAASLYFLPPVSPSATLSNNAGSLVPPQIKAIQKILPELKNIEIQVAPPAYTRVQPFAVSEPNFKVPEGSVVTWKIRTAGKISALHLSLNSGKFLVFQKIPDKPDTYVLTWKPEKSTLYSFSLNGRKSEVHALEIQPDQKPEIIIRKPKPSSDIAFGEPQFLNLEAIVTDDYGLRKASLLATVAQGSGESVKFKEVNYPLSLIAIGNISNAKVLKKIDLKTLGMTYGDELYFYVQAWDHYRGYTRSETHFIQLEDTTVVTDGNDLSLGVSVVPAYFRSQRQLIIDTEKLIQEKKGLTPPQFQERSNDLGAEQKLLRLRYGKFLGEEAVTVIGANPEAEHHAGDGHDHGSNSEENNSAAGLLAPYIHKHDTEEDATYFEPTVKAQLKAALAHMWEAELQLRLGKPAAALPFEYKALRQLKEVQQKSRAYVRKMGFTPPQLKEKEKRLTGELTKIEAPQEVISRPEKISYPNIRKALTLLHKPVKNLRETPDALSTLQLAGQELSTAALENPGKYLSSLRDLRKLVNELPTGKIACTSCIYSVTAAFESILPKPNPAPVARPVYRHRLASEYFRQLK